VLNIAAPLMMLALLYLLNMAWSFFMETRSRRLITGLFGTYVPKELVAEMSKNPEEYSMAGESRDMTVLFSDVRDFTSISEGLTPEGLKDMMNAYLTEMTEIQSAAYRQVHRRRDHGLLGRARGVEHACTASRRRSRCRNASAA
jgi:adenylate cyclase